VTDNRYSNELPGRRAGRERRFGDGEPPVLDPGAAGRGVARLASVWTRTTARAFFDTVGVVTQLAADVTDTLVDTLSPVPAKAGTSGPVGPDSNLRRAPMLTQVSDSVAWALQDAADVISRSAEQLNHALRTGGEIPPAESSSAARAGTTSAAPPAGG
jgi:hypothetical protein